MSRRGHVTPSSAAWWAADCAAPCPAQCCRGAATSTRRPAATPSTLCLPAPTSRYALLLHLLFPCWGSRRTCVATTCRVLPTPRSDSIAGSLSRPSSWPFQESSCLCVLPPAYERLSFIPPGLQNLPEDWQCPTCGADKKLFVSKQRQVAGFAENQVRMGQARERHGLALSTHPGGFAAAAAFALHCSGTGHRTPQTAWAVRNNLKHQQHQHDLFVTPFCCRDTAWARTP